MRFLLIGFAILSTGCALKLGEIKPHSKLLHTSIIFSAGCGAADLSTTMYYLGKGSIHEGNPLLRPVQRNPIAFTALKWGSETVLNVAAFHLHDSYPKVALGILGGNAIAKCALAFHNDKLGKGVK